MFILNLLVASPLLLHLASSKEVHSQEVDFRWSSSLYPPYVDAAGNSKHWIIKAFVSAYNSVRLTADAPSQTGYVQSVEVLLKFRGELNVVVEAGGSGLVRRIPNTNNGCRT